MPLLFSTNASRLKVWLEEGGNPNLEDPSGFSSIHTVAWICRSDLLELLVEFGATVDTRDINGITPLMLAAERGCTPVILILLREGAIPDGTDLEGRTALSRAVKGCHLESVTILGEKLYSENLLTKEEGFSFRGGGEVAPCISSRRGDPVIWVPVIKGVPDFSQCYLSVTHDQNSDSLEAVDISGDEWYIFIAGDEFIARRKEQ